MADSVSRKRGRQRPWPESGLLLAACLADLGLTVALIQGGHAVEANPLLAAYLAWGLEWFLVAKAVLLGLIPVGMVEWLRERFPSREGRLRTVLRVGLAAYGALYVVGGVAVNL